MTAIILVSVFLVALWTDMWLLWMFKGDVRNWIVSLMPPSWIAKTSKTDVLAMSEDELTLFIAAESDMPVFLRGVLTCSLCASAWLAGAGTLLTLPILPSFWIAPLVWGCSAYIANRMFEP